MTTETIPLELTPDEIAALDQALQDRTASSSLEAVRQKIRQVTTTEPLDPLERVTAAVDAVTAADQRVTQLIEHRRQAILAALDAGYTQQAVADHLGRSQPRIAQMLKSNKS